MIQATIKIIESVLVLNTLRNNENRKIENYLFKIASSLNVKKRRKCFLDTKNQSELNCIEQTS